MPSPPKPVPIGEPTIVWLQPEAPPKPALGAPCNGCGLCCLAEPCPLGMWVSRRRHGACDALRWNGPERQYRCGLVSDPGEVTGWTWAWPWLLRRVSALARRWVAAGQGCDADVQAHDLHQSLPSPGRQPTPPG